MRIGEVYVEIKNKEDFANYVSEYIDKIKDEVIGYDSEILIYVKLTYNCDKEYNYIDFTIDHNHSEFNSEKHIMRMQLREIYNNIYQKLKTLCKDIE